MGIEDKNPNEDKQPEEVKPKEDIYQKLVTVQPKREVDAEDAEDGHKPLDEAELDTSNLTDLQATLHKLYPKFRVDMIDRIAQSAMVARIAPDIFLDQISLTVIDVWESLTLENRITFQEVLNLVYFAFSIGLDGKGRIDALELAGSAKEAAELEKVTQGLGL